ncbi:MAG: protein-S-isoprenylcysteine O-methyltransferase Ste14 [Granulosicoccus sp.]|jgi:protein-S-isoprenylcysteine O-methyltransferase Ste14
MKHPGFSLILVITQFLLIAMLASPVHDLISTRTMALIGALLIIDGVYVAIWALISMPRGTFRVMPEPAATAQLTQSGPYRWLRHPMYSAVLLAALGAAISHATFGHSLIFLALIVVLLLKIHREEQYLLATYNEYADYTTRTKALIPFIY